ncbi:conserved hypothetical protein [Leishmania major strain Friedlin]|uniref:Uncharacterized protein n=1 Tax=Leishmania major TaxID=5664 RepID=E9ACZ5_LEIMA|nr:conserved hypothetical protein [Leishmania major strain Friedlin]7ANE_s Chain s, mS33 [Leishmania major]CAG9576619.1 mitoribosomal_protein_mS33 [Leishmania major strain Friedlin]CBZ12078.1 conserved hypothetical protein [Leishmania major strain Friedlin]|eukprot:XP_003721824.1 conserved hypothetical protein [Leishmania major strain Friedlin]
MLRSSLRYGVHKVGYTHPHHLPVPCAQRWDLRLARARIFQEYIEEKAPGAWQLEDERHMSPEFNTFTGYPMRNLRPGYGQNLPEFIMKKRLPNNTHYELFARRDIPNEDNAMYGKLLYDMTIHGTSLPSIYRMHKDINKAQRNDRKLSGNRFKVLNSSGAKSPPSGFEAIPDAVEEEDD